MGLLGVDVWTSGSKAAIFSEDRRLLALAYEEYDYQHPQPGWYARKSSAPAVRLSTYLNDNLIP